MEVPGEGGIQKVTGWVRLLTRGDEGMKRAVALLLALMMLCQGLPGRAEEASDIYQVVSDELTAPVLHTVRFLAEGEVISTVFVMDGAAVEYIPEAPALPGQRLVGWYAGNTLVTAETPVTADMDVTAVYTAADEAFEALKQSADYVYQSAGTFAVITVAGNYHKNQAPETSAVTAVTGADVLEAWTVSGIKEKTALTLEAVIIALPAEGPLNAWSVTDGAADEQVGADLAVGDRIVMALDKKGPQGIALSLGPEEAGGDVSLDAGEHVSLTGALPEGLTAAAQKTEMTEKVDDHPVLCAYDISLSLEGAEWQPDGSVQVSVTDGTIGASLAAGNEIAVYYVPEEGTPVLQPLISASGNTAVFSANHFSTYAVVELTEKTVELTNITSDGIDLNKGYILTITRNATNYATNTVSTNLHPDAIKATKDINSASRYYFESTATKEYYNIYTYSDSGSKVYININGTTTDLSGTAQALKVENKDSFLLISSNGYYLNIYSRFSNTEARFAGYNIDDEGCRILLMYTEQEISRRDPLGLKGKNYIIVNEDQDGKGNNDGYRAMMAQAAAVSSGFQGMAVREVEKTSEGKFFSESSVSEWTFVPLNNGNYYLQPAGQSDLYLNIASNTSSNTGADVTLSGTPCELTLIRLGSQVIIARADDNQRRLDCFHGRDDKPNRFSSWRENDSSINRRFTLGTLEDGSIVYSYQHVPLEGDDGTPQDLPEGTSELWTEGYTVKDPSRQTYVSLSDTLQWTYTFDHWEDSDGKTYQPGEPVAEAPEGKLTLTAVWTCQGPTEVEHTVQYVTDLAASGHTAAGTTPVLNAELENNQESMVISAAAEYTTRGMKPDYYVVSGSSQDIYEFIGWRTETGELIAAGDTINALSYDSDGDGITTLTAAWQGNTYVDGKTRKVLFYVSVDTVSEDIFNNTPTISTNAAYFTPELHTTLMDPRVTSPSSNPWTYLVNYQPNNSSSMTITEADRLIRNLGTGDGLEVNGTAYSTLEFPTNEEILSLIRANYGSSSKWTVLKDGKRIEPDTLTTENYTVRWYVCKYQNDGWHVDGKLIPKLNLVNVTKTFDGDETALEHIPEDYYITLTDQADSSHTAVLTLKSGTGNTAEYGRLEGTLNAGTYGWLKQSGNTYTWIVPVAAAATFRVKEYNYNVTAGGKSYGVVAQYSVTDTATGTDTVPLTLWFSEVSGYTTQYEVDEINVEQMQATNLFNTYVETGTFIIQKRDAGTGYVPMPGVAFSVYKMNGSSRQRLTLNKVSGTAVNDGRFTVLHGDGGAVSEAVTGSDGNIYLTFPKPDAGQTNIYLIEETVPVGYKEREDGKAPSFIVQVDEYGNFTLLDPQVVPEGGTMRDIRIGTLSEEGASVLTGIMVSNQPIRLLDVTAVKTWGEGQKTSKVRVQVTGSVNGEVKKTAEAELSADTDWAKHWESTFPLVIGNELVSYEILETGIGNYDEDDEEFGLWQQTYSDPVYYDEAGNILPPEEGGTGVDPKYAYDVRKIGFGVTNTRKEGSATVTLVKTDDQSEVLTTARFRVWEKADDETTDITSITYKDTSVSVLNSPESVYSTVGSTLILDIGKEYYIEEIKAPEGYQQIDGFVRIMVDADGKVTQDSEWKDGILNFKVDQVDPPAAVMTVTNTPILRTVQLKKVNEAGEVISESSAYFTLSGTPTIGRTFTATELSTFNGLTETVVLPYGTYTLEETQAPEGYSVLNSKVTIRVNSAGVQAVGNAAGDHLTVEQNDENVWVISVVNGGGLEMKLTKTLAGKMANLSDSFTLKISSDKIVKSKYTGTKNGDDRSFTATPADGDTKGWLELGGVGHNDTIVIKGLEAGEYTVEESYTGYYTPSFTVTDSDGDEIEIGTSADTGITVKMTGSLNVDVTNTLDELPSKSITVKKQAETVGTVKAEDVDLTVWFAVNLKGSSGFLTREDGKVWTESIEIVNGVPQKDSVTFDGLESGTYEVWEVSDAQASALSPGTVVIASDSQSKPIVVDTIRTIHDGGVSNNLTLSDTQPTGELTVINTYAHRGETRNVTAKKKWYTTPNKIQDDCANVNVPEGAWAELTLYQKGSDEAIRTIRLNGTPDDSGETSAWEATFDGVASIDENGKSITYVIRETDYSETINGVHYYKYKGETNDGGSISNAVVFGNINVYKQIEVQPRNETMDALVKAAVETDRTLKVHLTGPYGYDQTFEYTNTGNVYNPSLTITGLPAGTYTLEEVGHTNLISGRQWNPTESWIQAGNSAQMNGQSVITFEVGSNGQANDTIDVRMKNDYSKYDVTATKVWDDNGNTSHPAVQLTLYKTDSNNNRSTVSTETIPANASGDALTVTWKQLEQQYTYKLEEAALEGYETVITGDMFSGFTVTNTAPDTVDLILTKTVTGNAGDPTKAFPFTVACEGLTTVTVQNAAGTEVSSISLISGEYVILKDLPIGATVTVTETGAAEYTATATLDGTAISSITGNPASGGTDDGTRTITFTVPEPPSSGISKAVITNTRTIEIPPTGLGLESAAYLALLGLALAMGVMMAAGRRRRRDRR